MDFSANVCSACLGLVRGRPRHSMVHDSRLIANSENDDVVDFSLVAMVDAPNLCSFLGDPSGRCLGNPFQA